MSETPEYDIASDLLGALKGWQLWREERDAQRAAKEARDTIYREHIERVRKIGVAEVRDMMADLAKETADLAALDAVRQARMDAIHEWFGASPHPREDEDHARRIHRALGWLNDVVRQAKADGLIVRGDATGDGITLTVLREVHS